MAEIELRHLRVVQAVAEAGSLTKAAARLGVSQPALTAQLTRVERMLGGSLFVRGPHGANPTALGRFIAGRAEALLADMHALAGAAHQQANGAEASAPLVVGSMAMPMLGPFVDQLRQQDAAGQISSMVMPTAKDLLGLLSAGRIDVALLERCGDGFPEIACEIRLRMLTCEPSLVAVADSHPLASQEIIDLAELADSDWVVPPPHDNPYRSALLTACAAAGFTPRLRHFTNDTSMASTLVKQGAICLAAAASRFLSGIVVKPLANDPIVSEILLATRADTPSAEVADGLFRAAARGYMATLDFNPVYLRRWWTEHPQTHAAIDLALDSA